MDEASIKRYLKDVEYFSKKLEEDPTSRLFMPLAFAYLRLGRFDEVIEVCSKGLDNHPDYHAAKVVLANAFLEKGMIEEAKHLLFDVVEKMPDNYRANKMLGDILRESGDILGATIYYRTALVTSSEDFELRVLLEELTDSLGTKAFHADEALKNIEDAVGKAETAPIDEEVSELKTEIGKIDEMFGASTEEKPSVVVEIPEEVVPAGKLDLDLGVVAPEPLVETKEEEKLTFDTFDFGNLDQLEIKDEHAEQKKEQDIKIEHDLLEKFDFGISDEKLEIETHKDLESFDTFADALSKDIHDSKDKTAEETLQSTIEKQDEITSKELDFALFDEVEGVSTTKNLAVEESSNITIDTIVEEEPSLRDINLKLDIEPMLEETTAKMSEISEETATEFVDEKHAKVVEELERWLNNIKKIKETRNVQ